jgi:hypothetical protein
MIGVIVVVVKTMFRFWPRSPSSLNQPRIKGLGLQPQCIYNFFAPGKSWDNVRSAAPHTESRLAHLVRNKCVGFLVVEQLLTVQVASKGFLCSSSNYLFYNEAFLSMGGWLAPLASTPVLWARTPGEHGSGRGSGPVRGCHSMRPCRDFPRSWSTWLQHSFVMIRLDQTSCERNAPAGASEQVVGKVTFESNDY